MKATQYNAISIDGFIDDHKGSSDWVSDVDWAEFARYIKEKKAIIMGRKTYEVGIESFPYDCELNIVMTRDDALIESMKDKDKILFTNKSPKEIIKLLDDKGFEECLVIGGGDINAQFLTQGLIDEIVLSIHPLVLGKGLKIFQGDAQSSTLERVSTKELDEGLLQAIYKVLK